MSPRSPKGPLVVEIPVDPTILEAGDHNGSTFYQHARFLDLVREGGAPDVSLRDGAQAVAMGHAAQDAARGGGAIMLQDPNVVSDTAVSQEGAMG